MWKITVLLLSVAAVASATRQGPAKHYVPSNLLVNTINYHTVRLHWDFKKPANLESGEIIFSLNLAAENTTLLSRNFKPASYYELENLMPSTAYSVEVGVEVQNKTSDWSSSKLIGKFTTCGKGDRDLEAPSNLQIGKLSHRTVRVGWDFKQPARLNLDEIGFNLILETNGSIVMRKKLKTGTHYEINDLKPNTSYDVEVFADHYGRVSPKLKGNFTTLAEEWPTPYFMDTNYKSNDSLVTYEVTWDISATDSLKNFILEACLPDCHSHLYGPTNRSAIVYSDIFYQPYSLIVTAIFEEPVIGEIKRSSYTITGLAPTARPEKVVTVRSEHIGDFIEVEWIPPKNLNGDLSHYEISVFDPENTLSEFNGQSTETKVTLWAPSLSGDFYEGHLRVVNMDPETGQYRRSEDTKFEVLPYVPPKPLAVKVINQTSRSISFSVTLAETRFGNLFKLKSNVSHTVRYDYENLEAVIHGLSPYKWMELNVSACYVHEVSERKTCGEPFTLTAVTDVCNPSKVRDLRGQLWFFQMGWLRWKRPKFAHGPIDGYIIYTNALNRDRNGTSVKEFMVPRSARSYSFKGVRLQDKYQLSVAAFNWVSKNTTLLLGEKVTVHDFRDEIISDDIEHNTYISICLYIALFMVWYIRYKYLQYEVSIKKCFWRCGAFIHTEMKTGEKNLIKSILSVAIRSIWTTLRN